MNSPRTLRCAMKMRTCGLFWHKTVISLTLPHRHASNPPSQGCLTIARPKIFGGKIKVSLGSNSHTITFAPVSGKDARHYQLTICYGPHRRVTLRAPTKSIYETWWTALESALALPTFIVVSATTPVRLQTIVLAPVHSGRHNAARTRHVGVLQPLTEVDHEDELTDDVPVLEAGGPTSPSELDILASWRTWGSLDYFASQPSFSSARMTYSNLEPTPSNNASDNDDNRSVDSRDRISVDSNISEFWSRPSEWQDEILQHDSTNIAAPALLRTRQPQHDGIWSEEVADFVFQQKTLIHPKSNQYPTTPIPRQLHPFLKYAMI